MVSSKVNKEDVSFDFDLALIIPVEHFVVDALR